MSPDETHTKYFAEHPNGNHDVMSPETRQAVTGIKDSLDSMNKLFADHAKEDAQRFTEINKNMSETHSSLKTDLAVVIEKLDGVNRRLDISNGRIAKNENKIGNWITATKMLQITTEEAHAKREQRSTRAWEITSRIGFAVVGFIMLIIGALTMAVLQRTGVVDVSVEKKVDSIVAQLQDLELIEDSYAKDQKQENR